MFYKYSFLFLILFVFTVTCFSDVWNENFDDMHSNSYGSSFTCTISGSWTASDAGNFSYCNSTMGSYGPTINDDKANAHITTPSLNTCGTVTFDYAYKSGDYTNVFLLQTSNNGSDFSTLDTHTLGSSANESWVNYSFDINDASSSIYIRILSDDQNAHLFIDNFSVTNFESGATANLTISHSGLTEDNLNGATINLVLENDTFSDFGSDDITLNNAPAGTTVNTASNSDDTNATVTLAFDGTDFDSDINNFSITVAASGLAGLEAVTSNDLTITAVIEPDPEPDNHVTAFEATENGGNSIYLGWTDATGTNLPSGYLIMMNTSNSFSDPIDGTPVSDDTNNLNAAFGDEILEWTGLDPETEYYFKIYPYSNSGTDIDYKTDGTVPVANATTLSAPSIIAFCGFEDSGDTWSYIDNNPSRFGSWGIETSLGSIDPYAGTYFWGMNDIDNLDTYYLDFDNINIAGYNDVEISFYWTDDAFDSGDNMFYSLSYDNGSSWESEVEFYHGAGTAHDWTVETISINNSETQVSLRIRGDQNGGSDYAGWDDVKITGTPTNSPLLTISHAGLTESNLDGAVISLLIENDTFSAGLSSAHITLNNQPAGTTVDSVIRTDESNSQVTLAFDGTDFDSDITDFYIVVSADGVTGTNSVTSNNLSITAIIEPDPEPADHVTDFDAAENGTDSILLGWTDAIDASGYLIKINTVNSFTGPEDGTAVNDGDMVINITQGTEIYNWSGLDADTQYYFKIWPYSNSGSDIDYKTDGTVPVANATTSALPDTPALLISEVVDPQDVYQTRYIELYNASGLDIDFDTQTWYLCRQTNGGSWEDNQLTGLIQSNGVFVCANSNNDESDYFYVNFGFMADYDFGGSSGNGDDGYFLFYNGDHSTGTLIDAYGVIDEDGTDTLWEYEDCQAERIDSISEPNPVWTSSEWQISAANVADVSPGSHSEGGVLHQTQNMNAGDSVTFPSEGTEDVTIDINGSETETVHVSVSISNQNYPGAGNTYSGWWDINISGNTEAVTLNFTYDEAELNGILETYLVIYHLSGNDWENLGGIIDFDNNTITLSDYAGSFSPFTLGDTENIPKPITLSSFSASFSFSIATLQWITQSEVDNAGWNVFRAEEDPEFEFSMIINPEIIPGQGTTSISTSYSFQDNYELEAGGTYYYWLESISYSGDSDHYGPVMLKIPLDEEEETPDVPEQFGLLSNYPNPFNPTTTIRYNLPVDVRIELSIYNIKGEKIKTLESGEKSAGYYQISWDGTNSNNEQVASGVYFYELITPLFVKSRSMLLIK